MSTDSFLDHVKRIDICVSQEPPTRGFQEIRPLLDDPDLRRYFFDNLQKPAWLSILRESDFFKQPPSEGRWPEAGYLARMAKVEATAAQVCEIILSIPDTENRLVHAELVEAARAMPPTIAARLIDKIKTWARGASGFLAADFGVLIGKFAIGGGTSAAVQLARVILEVMPPRGGDESEHGLFIPMPQTRLDLWDYEQILTAQIPELVKAAPAQGLGVLCDLLSDAIRFSLREPEKSAPSDVSQVWRPAVEEHGQNLLPELRSLLTRAVRDAAASIVRSRQITLLQTVAALERRKPPWWIFRRVAMYLLCEFGTRRSVKRIGKYLTAREVFDAPECIHEYVRLFQRCFPALKLDQQRQILDWIDAGPQPEQLENLRRNVPQFTGKPLTDEDVARFSKAWRRDWLQRLGDHLPPEKRSERDALIQELGPSEHPDLRSYRSEVVGSQSPISLDDFKGRSVADQLKYLREWQPPSDQFMGPSRSGLGEQLAKLVTEHPDSYASQAERFTEVDPTYQRFLLNGLREAVEKGRSFDWAPVFRLCQQMLTEPLEIPGRKGLSLDEDQDRTWCRSAIATLLETALRQKELPIPIDLKDELWKVLEPLSNDANPTPEHEARYGGSNMDPSHLALNSTRGQAIAAVIFYAWRVSRLTAKDGQISSFDLVPKARNVLEAHLDKQLDPSLAIRSVYGRMLILLFQVDKQWVGEKAATIFPSDDSEQPYWEAAWSSYLAFSQLYWDVFEVLRRQYDLAVDRLTRGRALPRVPVDLGERLAEHLMLLYWSGRIKSEGSEPLWNRFWSNASGDVRKHALWYFGRLLYDAKDAIDAELLARLQILWSERLSVANAAGNPGNYAAEIAQFGWWFCSKKFAEEWAIGQLELALDFASHVDPDQFIFGSLAEASNRRPLESVRCLGKLLAKTNQWHVSAYEKQIGEVLKTARDAGGDSQSMARTINDALMRRGVLKFRDLFE